MNISVKQKIFFIGLFLVLANLNYAKADDLNWENDPEYYCKYVELLAKSKSQLLLSPELITRITPLYGADSGISSTLRGNSFIGILGLTKDLSDYKRRSFILSIAKEECKIYRNNQNLVEQLKYYISSIQKEALLFKLQVLQEKKTELNSLWDDLMQKVQTRNETIQTLYHLESILKKIDVEEEDINIELSKLTLVQIKREPFAILKKEAENLENSEIKKQSLQNKLDRQNNWGLNLVGGLQSNLSFEGQAASPFIGFTFRYNLADIPSQSNVSKSNKYFALWKQNKKDGISNNLNLVEQELSDLQQSVQRKKRILTEESEKTQNLLQKVSSESLSNSQEANKFKLQLFIDKANQDIELLYISKLLELLENASQNSSLNNYSIPH